MPATMFDTPVSTITPSDRRLTTTRVAKRPSLDKVEMESGTAAMKRDLVELAQTHPELLSPESMQKVAELTSPEDPDAAAEKIAASLVANTKTRDDMWWLWHQYATTVWMQTESTPIIMAICTTLVALCRKFGYPPFPAWERFNVAAARPATAR